HDVWRDRRLLLQHRPRSGPRPRFAGDDPAPARHRSYTLDVPLPGTALPVDGCAWECGASRPGLIFDRRVRLLTLTLSAHFGTLTFSLRHCPATLRDRFERGFMSEQYIFTIENLGKAYGKREVLRNIWLAFYPGAKIGVIGSNGAGKSTLLRVMGGVEKDFLGSARLTPGFRVGYVPQEPRLDETRDVKGNIELAVAKTRGLLNRHEEISNKLGEQLEPDEMEKLLEELGKVQEQIDAANAWELDRQLEIAMDAMRLPPGDAKATTLSGGERRRVALCKVL